MTSVGVILLTKNAEQHLPEILEALFAQASAHQLHILALDSGSRDGTLDILRRRQVEVVQVPPEAFQHGRTRNLGARLCAPEAEYLVFLSQDATPLPGWLDALLGAVAADSRIAGAFSRHVPRPGCNPMLARRILEEWPQAGGMQRMVKRWNEPSPGLETAHDLAHFSNTSSCIRTRAWEQIPFPEVEFAEDVAWASLVLRAGWSLVYEPASAVLHSHSGSLARQFRENVDHGYGVRQALGGSRQPLMPPRHGAADRLRRDVQYIWRTYPSPGDRLRWLAYLPLWSAASLGGQWVGAHMHRWPVWLKRRLSWQAQVQGG